MNSKQQLKMKVKKIDYPQVLFSKFAAAALPLSCVVLLLLLFLLLPLLKCCKLSFLNFQYIQKMTNIILWFCHLVFLNYVCFGQDVADGA